MHVILFHATKMEDDVELIEEDIEGVPNSFTRKIRRKRKLELSNIVGISFFPSTFSSIDPPQPTTRQWQPPLGWL